MAVVQDFVRELEKELTVLAPGGELSASDRQILNIVATASSLENAMQLARNAGLEERTVQRVLQFVEVTMPEPELQEMRVEQAEQAEEEARQEERAAAEEALPEGYRLADEGELDAVGRPIVAYNADGQPLVVSEITGELTIGVPRQEDQLPPFIGGLPEDYEVVAGDEVGVFQATGEGFGPSGIVNAQVFEAISAPRAPQYREGDQLGQFVGYSVEMREKISEALVAAGFLDEDDHEIYAGQWTSMHAQAMARAMTEANIAGKTWNAILKANAAAIEKAGGLPGTQRQGRVRVIPAYREPDVATLAQQAKSLMRGQLGRDPLDWEMTLLADEMRGAYRSQYDAEVQAARQEFEAGNHATVQAEGGGNVFTTGGSVQAVDPESRIRERFESLFGDEIRLAEDRRESLDNISNVFSTLTSVSRMMGS